MKNIKLKNGILVTPKGFLRCDCLLREGRIDLSGKETVCERTVDLAGKYVLPGFVNIHFHGYNLFDFTLGRYCPETQCYDDSQSAFSDGYEMLGKTLSGFGVTGYYGGTIGAPAETLKKSFANMAKYMEKQKKTLDWPRVFGGLLEGTFINPDMAGAQNPEFVFEPSREAFDSIEDNGTIKLANVVADYGKPSYALIEYLVGTGVVVGTGHTNATCRQIFEAVEAGLKYCIHLTNGPTGNSYKIFNGGGAVEGVLKSDELYAEQILDGYHVNPAYIRDIIKRKGVERIVGVTDCMFAAGSDVKQFNLGGVKGQVSEDGKYISVVGKPNTLCSSNLTMDRAFENLLNWLGSKMEGIWNRKHEAMDFEKALVATAKILSTNPCLLTGLEKEGYGCIVDGAKADLCVLDIVGSAGSYKVQVDLTIVDGNIVYSK